MEAPGPDRVDVLVVAAHAPEMAGLRVHLSDRLAGRIRGLEVRGKAVGIGLAAAGPATARALLSADPRALILIGSCGVYPGLPHYRPHDVLVASRVRLLSHAVTAERSAFPAPMQTSVETDRLLTAGLSQPGGRVFVAPVANPLARTTDDTLAAAIHPATHCEGENLEAFAVAMAARAAGVPFAAVFGVANLVGSTGDHDWRQFQREAVNRAAEVLTAWLQTGAPGLPHG
ncbi:MAG: hypothetical protein ACFCGT_00725 [Sandaracinaceae bacterium]